MIMADGLKFRKMLIDISTEIEKRNISLDMVKFVLDDYINIKRNVENAKNAFDVFHELDNRGTISMQDVTVIIAMLELLTVGTVRNIIAEHQFPNPDVDYKVMFTEYRIRIVRIGLELREDKMKDIAGLFRVPEKNSSNQWKLLQYLQTTACLDGHVLNKDTLQKFIDFAGIIETGTVNPPVPGPAQEPPLNAARVNPPIAGPAEEEPPIAGQAQGNSVDPGKFLELLNTVKEWYTTRGKINLVKVLLKDVLEETCNVEEIDNFFEFFEKLQETNQLCPENLTILYEIIHCTAQFGLVQEIKNEYVPLCPDLEAFDLVHVSPFRKKLVKFGNALRAPNLDTIDGLYNNPRVGYKEKGPWLMILHLEENGHLTEDGLTDFIEKLNKNKIHAVKKLR